MKKSKKGYNSKNNKTIPDDISTLISMLYYLAAEAKLVGLNDLYKKTQGFICKIEKLLESKDCSYADCLRLISNSNIHDLILFLRNVAKFHLEDIDYIYQKLKTSEKDNQQ
jgi:hypothetical protein